MRDASNEVTDMNMSERHVGKNAAIAIDFIFVAGWRRCRRKNGAVRAIDAGLKPKPYSRSSRYLLVFVAMTGVAPYYSRRLELAVGRYF